MPQYSYTGDEPRLLAGLIQGVNAHHVAAPGNPEVPEGTTVVVNHGDSVDTGAEAYPAYCLTDISTGQTADVAAEQTAAPVTPPAPPAVVATPADKPAPAVITPPAESAPADATTAPAPTF